MGRVIAVTNQKGGVGKTTTTINLGAALAEKGHYTLLIDGDPQGALSIGLGLPAYDLEFSLYSILTDTRIPIAAVTHHIRPHLDLVPSNIDLAGAELQLVAMMGREFILRDAIATVRDRYDFVLIDCPPSLGLLTVNALTAADEILVPLQCEFLAMRGLDTLIDVVARVQRRLNPKLRMLGIVPTMYNPRRVHSREVLDKVRATYPNKILNVAIKESTRFAQAPAERRTLLEIDGNGDAAESYRALAEVILNVRTEQ
ncbi:MAG: ParA family protein [Chloroflexi bacterium]|nr:ParA family protein [Chloroflexota bacterium]